MREIKDIYLKLNMESEYSDFHLLYYAKDDLIYSEHQWYWPEANRQNIDAIIREQFLAFTMKCERERDD